MKIFCIGRNYAAHAKELNNPLPEEPVVFMKPPTALLKDGRPFYYPDFSENIHYEGELVLKVAKNGKAIAEKFARDYYKEVTVGIDFTARDIQQQCKEKGLPWEKAKGFDQSAAIGEFIPLKKNGDLTFSLKMNGETMQHSSTDLMLFSFDKLIVHLSEYFTLNKGDLIFTGTPSGVGKVSIGDYFEGFIEDQPLLKCEIK